MERNKMIDVILNSIKTDIQASNLSSSKHLKCLFNDLNGNDKDCVYPFAVISEEGNVIQARPESKIEDCVSLDSIKTGVDEIISLFETTGTLAEVNSLLDQLESQLIYIPDTLSGIDGVSLYDYISLHAGITAAKSTSAENCLFLSMDLSGVQNFIYHLYDNGDVLKNLRARSFYLEIIMENAIDELLEKFDLCRTNLIYSGGGHAYLLLPNTEEAKKIINDYDKEINTWLRKKFGTELFIAFGFTECTEDDLMNKPVGSYNRIFRDVSKAVSERKRHRYSSVEIIELNAVENNCGRECRLCHNSSMHVINDDDDLCEMCSGLAKLSGQIQHGGSYYVISNKKGCIEVGDGAWLSVCSAIADDSDYIRSYVKNSIRYGSKTIYIGDYRPKDTHSIQDLVDMGSGIKRMGIVRGDIDNLGHAFVNGFAAEKQNIYKATSFSRSMSVFFKYNINKILKEKERKVSIVYSGGDDVFILGDWKDTLDSIIDISTKLSAYSLGALSLSAGFGMFDEKTPIYYVADYSGELEDKAKHLDGKNAIALFDADSSDYVYHWNEFVNKVYGDKYQSMTEFILMKDEHGMNFVYNMLELIKASEDKLNLARFAYLMARMEPKVKKGDSESEAYYKAYKNFSSKMIDWIMDEKERKELITAIYLFVYANRKRNKEE